MRLNPLKKAALLSASGGIVSIEFNSNSLRLAFFAVRGKARMLTRAEVISTESLSDEAITEHIKKSIAACDIKNPSVILIIPPQLLITKNIEVPSQDAAEIRDIMNLQAARHTPYSREEIIIDYATIGVYRKSYTKILLVIVKKEIVRKQIESIRSAGSDVRKVCFAPESIARFSSKIHRARSDTHPLGILYVDQAFSTFTVVFKRAAIFSRSIPIGRQHLMSDYSRFSKKFVEEIKKTIEVYKSEDIETVPQLILFLETDATLHPLEPLLVEASGITVEHIAYQENISCAKGVEEIFSQQPPAVLAEVIAAAVMHDELSIDLIPEETKLKRLFEQRSREIIKTGVFSLAIFILIFILLTSKISFKRLYLDSLQERAQLIEKDAKELEHKFRQMQMVRRYLSSRGYSLEVLDALHEYIPENLRLNELRFNRAGSSLAIKGTADSLTAIYAYVDSLSNVVYFKDVIRKATTKRQEGKKTVEDFELAITLRQEHAEVADD